MHAQQLLDDIYAAIDDDEALARLPSNLASMCDARSANVLYARAGEEPFQQLSYFPDEYVPIYLEHFVDKDPWRHAAQALGSTGRAISMDDHVPPDRFVQTEFYNDLLRPIGDDTGRCMGIEFSTSSTLLHIAVHRSLAAPEFSPADLLRMEHLFAHVARVLRLRSLVARESNHRQSLQDMIDATQLGVMVVDIGLKIVTCSNAGRAYLNGNDGIGCREGRLEIMDHRTAAAIRASVRSVIQRDHSERTTFLCARRSGRAHYRLAVLPAGTINGAVLVIEDPVADIDHARLSSLSRAYGLTASETQLAECLAGGLTLTEVADRRNISVETVRTQLKSIFAKTGAHRQSELVRLLS